MIRLIVRTVIALVANAVGLLVAAALLDGMELNVTEFITALVLFTIVYALMLPFLASQFRRGGSLILPFLGLKKYLEERRA